MKFTIGAATCLAILLCGCNSKPQPDPKIERLEQRIGELESDVSKLKEGQANHLEYLNALDGVQTNQTRMIRILMVRTDRLETNQTVKPIQ